MEREECSRREQRKGRASRHFYSRHKYQVKRPSLCPIGSTVLCYMGSVRTIVGALHNAYPQAFSLKL
jgi:hypothetical protein